MEEFGARTECLAEVEQSDVYVGIVAFRIGSIDSQSGKSYTQIEYERAKELGKEILVYLADEHVARVRYADIDTDLLHREKLKAFKATLLERHTVNTFSTPEDLADKLRRDFRRHFESREGRTEESQDEFDKTLGLVRRFLLVPNSVIGREALLRISFSEQPYPASPPYVRRSTSPTDQPSESESRWSNQPLYAAGAAAGLKSEKVSLRAF
jgi:hypothetical protein